MTMMKALSKHNVIKKRVPQRTCVACQQIKAKKDLLRVVRTPGGEIEIDDTGKKDGRGAYLCPTRECMDKALKGNKLEYTLRTSITDDNRDKLAQNIKRYLEGTN